MYRKMIDEDRETLQILRSISGEVGNKLDEDDRSALDKAIDRLEKRLGEFDEPFLFRESTLED